MPSVLLNASFFTLNKRFLLTYEYGNTGCGVFKLGYKIRKIFDKKHTYSKEIIEL